MLLKKKLLIASGALALVVGSAVGFKAVTGQCPIAALFCGECKVADAPQASEPAPARP